MDKPELTRTDFDELVVGLESLGHNTSHLSYWLAQRIYALGVAAGIDHERKAIRQIGKAFALQAKEE